MNICGKWIRSGSFHSCGALRKEMPNNLKGKKSSSQRWLVRQLQDPYVEKAKQENYRCRSAFKLLEINERFGIIGAGMSVVDCGAAPGSWTQVAVKATNSDGRNKDERKRGNVVAIDRLPIHPIDGATVLGNLDFTSKGGQERLRQVLHAADVVLSDMAPNATGVREMDHENIITLAYAAMQFAVQVLKVDGSLVIKVWDGGLSSQLEKDLARFFKTVKVVRPGATRDESSEKFLLSRGFKGLKV